MRRRLSLLLGALLALATICPAAAASGPRAVVAAFYAAELQPGTNRNLYAQYLDPATYALYARAQAHNREPHGLVLDYDPASGTQVGFFHATVGAATIAGAAARVPVELAVGLRSTSTLARSLTVVLHHHATGWRIYDWIYHEPRRGDWSFRTQLIRALNAR
ncbi:MAG TPA: hypothetical protein VMD91_13310 [Candidatus Sulfotelmatobacter sp.]|nr:hypothetical protein [Candidatus Sulfotelmatobacter sp.]